MSGPLVLLCQRVRPELACLGELGTPLLGIVGVIERVGATRDLDALGDPLFALDVLPAAGVGADVAVLGTSQWNEPVELAAASLGGMWLVSYLIVAADTALAGHSFGAPPDVCAPRRAPTW